MHVALVIYCSVLKGKTVRQCLVCRQRDDKSNLVRLYVDHQGRVQIDGYSTYQGARGVYVHRKCCIERGEVVAKKIGAALRSHNITMQSLSDVIDEIKLKESRFT